MKFCNKCHKRVLTTETFVGPGNYVWENLKFCRCSVHIIRNDDGIKCFKGYERGKGYA